MTFDNSKLQQQSKVSPGTTLISAGNPATSLILVHDGEVEACTTSQDGSFKRLYLLGKNSYPGFGTLISKRSYPIYYKTTKSSIISSFPAQGSFSALILGKLNVGIMSVRSLAQEIIQSQNTIKRYSSLLAQLKKASDNLSLAYTRCNPTIFSDSPSTDEEGSLLDPLQNEIQSTLTDFKQYGGIFPKPLTQEWLQSDFSRQLNRTYEFQSDFDTEEFNFLRRFLALPPALQGNIFKTDLNILQGISGRLSKILLMSHREIEQLMNELETLMSNIFQGEYCFLEKYYLVSQTYETMKPDLTLPEINTVIKYLHFIANSIQKNYSALTRDAYSNVSGGLDKIKDYIKEIQGEDSSNSSEAAEILSSVGSGVNVEAARKELNNSPQSIMSFLDMSADDMKNMLASLKAFKAEKNPLDSGGEPRKIRRQISNLYWKTYKKAYYKFVESNGNVPRNVKLMLRYGYFDDTLLDDEHIATLYSLEEKANYGPYSIVNATDWLSLIGEKKEPPSIDEMGQTFFEKLKLEHKDKGWKRETDVPEEFDNSKVRIDSELQNFLEPNVRLTSGQPASSFPILTRYQITIPLDKSYVDNEKLQSVIDQLLSIDFAAFHREVLVNDESQNIYKEFVQQQILPNFIIVPSIGSKIMMWQDLAGRNKASKGRIAVPVFATTDLFTLLLEAVGAFRWELTKTIMGPDWNNVSQPSITSDYTDYVQFYKKNRDLTPEIKEKLASEFKRFRNDRDRFVNDYINWIKFESEGVLKHNKVARSIFYRHVPFAKPIRDKLSTQPAYADLQNRFKNISNRKLRELEVRYRKYGEVTPDILQQNIEFYKA